MWAVRSDRADLFRLLLEKGADPTLEATDNFSIFKEGSYRSSPASEVFSLQTDEHVIALIEVAKCTDLRFKYSTPPDSVAMRLFSDMNPGDSLSKRARAFLDAKPSQEALDESLYYALLFEKFSVARQLVDTGANPVSFYMEAGSALDVIGRENVSRYRLSTAQLVDLNALCSTLEAKGYDLEKATARAKRWFVKKEAGSDASRHHAYENRIAEIRAIAKKEGKNFTSSETYPNPAP